MLVFVTQIVITELDFVPKLFYMTFQGAFIAALVALNWEFLTTEPDGVLLLVLVTVLSVATYFLFLMTGGTDPGYVRSPIFENHYETTDFVEEDDPNGHGSSAKKKQGSSAQRNA